MPILRLAPRRIIANLSIFFDVNLSPDEKSSTGFQKQFIIIPMKRAITDAPIRWIGKRLSKSFAIAAIASASANPGKSFTAFSIASINVNILSFTTYFFLILT